MWHNLLPAETIVTEATRSMWSTPATPAESRCIERAVPARRREFQAGRAAARAALRRLGIEGFDLLPGSGREPTWPTGIVGSITHDASECAAAVARSDKILALGIDVERFEPLSADLLPLVCSEAERRRWRAHAPYGADVWGKAVFSAKESFYKAYFPAVRAILEFHDVDIELRPEQGLFVARLVSEALPAFFGRRQATGRFALRDGRIWTAVALVR
jgi:4'-phosphopantetheinyl transferase EntD